jgi:hypothetical protein
MVEQKTTLELKLEKLRDICEKSPEHHIGLLALAETAFRRGLRLEALEAYQKVLREESVAEAHLCMAQMYRHHGLLAEAIAELRVLFELEPGYPEAVVFASELASETELPEDLQAVVVAGCGHDELALAKVRLSIARSLVLREGQELMAIQEANAGDPTFGYYIGETRKRLVYCEQVLSQLGHLEEARRTFQQEQARLREVSAKHPAAPIVEELPADLAQATPTEPEDAPVHPLFPPDADLTSEDQPPSFSEASELEPVSESTYAAVDEEEIEVFTEPVREEFAGSFPEEAPAESETPVPTPELWADPPLVADPPEESVSARIEDGPPLPSWRESVELEPELPRDVPPVGELWDDLPRPILPEPTRPSQEGLGLGLDLVPQLPMDLPAITEPDLVAPQLTLATVVEPEVSPMGQLGDDLLVIPTQLPEAQPPEMQISVEEETPIPQPVADPVLPEPVLPEPAMLETVADEVVSRVDFADVYAGLLGQLDTLMQTLAKTRSVSSVYLVNRDGYCIIDIAKDSLSNERLQEFICETVAFLETYAASPQYWVLECAGGIVVIQSVDSYHYLVTIGQSGANFGALRFTMDRIRPSFAEALSSALPAGH